MNQIGIRAESGSKKKMRGRVQGKKHEKMNVLYKVAYPTAKAEIELTDKERREVLTTVNPSVNEWEQLNKMTYVFLSLELYLMLEMAFSLGFDETEACAASKISRKKFAKLNEKYPLLRDKIVMWKQNPVMLAKSVVMKKIAEGNLYAAQWWLERKKKDEFSQSTKLEVQNTQVKRTEMHVQIEDIQEVRRKIPIILDEESKPKDAEFEMIAEEGELVDANTNG